MINNSLAWLATMAALVLGCEPKETAPEPFQGVVELDERVLSFEVPGRVVTLPAVRGKGRIFRVFDFLRSAEHGGPTDIRQGCTRVAAQSSQPGHLYVCQAAMSTSSDPRNQTWEVGANNLDFCESRMKLVSELRTRLVKDVLKDGESYAHVRRRYQQLLGT